MSNFEGIPIGGPFYITNYLLNVLRQHIPDPGIDDKNASDGSGHSYTRDAEEPFSITADGTSAVFPLAALDGHSPVVAVYTVSLGGVSQISGFDYLLQYGDKVGVPQRLPTRIQFPQAPAAGTIISGFQRYGKTVTTLDNKTTAQGSFINTNYSRDAMPTPKIQLQMSEGEYEAAAVGDNFDQYIGRGVTWFNPVYTVMIFSDYYDEAEILATKIAGQMFQTSHARNRFIPEIMVEGIKNEGYDAEIKAYKWSVRFKCRTVQVF